MVPNLEKLKYLIRYFFADVEITSAISKSDSTCGGPSTPATQEVPDLDILIDQLNAVMNSVGSGPDVRKRVALMQSKWNTLDVKAGFVFHDILMTLS